MSLKIGKLICVSAVPALAVVSVYNFLAKTGIWFLMSALVLVLVAAFTFGWAIRQEDDSQVSEPEQPAPPVSKNPTPMRPRRAV